MYYTNSMGHTWCVYTCALALSCQSYECPVGSSLRPAPLVTHTTTGAKGL